MLTQGSQDRSHRHLPHPRRRHGFTGSPGRAPQRADQLPHGTLQDPREGPSLAPRAAEARRPAPPTAGLPQAQGHGSLRGADQASRNPQVDSGWTSVRARRRPPTAGLSRPQTRRTTGSWRSSIRKIDIMHTREISVGGTHDLHRDRDASPSRPTAPSSSARGDTVVLVTACAAANPREGIDFLPLTVDYREYTYASGRIPGGFFKREGKPTRKGSAHEPPDRSADPAAVPVRMAPRDAGHRARALGRRRERFRRARDHRRLGGAGALEHPVHPHDRRRPRRSRRRRATSSIRRSSSARRSRLDLIVAGSKDAIVMVEAGAKEVSEEEIVQALEHAHAAIKEIVAGIDALAAAGRQEEDRGHGQGDRQGVLPRGRGEGLRAARRGDADQGQARRTTAPSTRCSPI